MSTDRTSPERKAVAGADHIFVWRPSDGDVVQPPTLTISWPSGSQSYVLSPVRPEDSITAISPDGSQITVRATDYPMAAAISGLVAEYGGQAWIDGSGTYQGPVRVMGVVSETENPPASGESDVVLQLAEPLPEWVTLVGSWALRWATHAATVPFLHVGAARLRSVRWSVPWQRRTGSTAPQTARMDRGVMHVCPVPFSTGLTDDDLFVLVPGWASIVPDRQSSWAEQRWAAQRALVASIRPHLPEGRFEDDVYGEHFLSVHALLTAAMIRRGHAALGYPGAEESAKALQDAADAALKRALEQVSFVDFDGDGVIDPGETSVQASGVVGLARSNVLDSGYDAEGATGRRSNSWDDR